MIFSHRLVLNVQNRSKMQHFGRVKSVSCYTRCESVVGCLSAPLPESGHQAYTSSHAVNERTLFPSAKGVTLREYPLFLAKNTKTLAPRQCQRRAICPQQPNILLTSNDDDVDQSWKRVPFTDSLPVCQATRKTVTLHSTLLVLLGEKSGCRTSSPCHGAFSNRSCVRVSGFEHRFAPK